MPFPTMHEALIPLQTEIKTFEEQFPILRSKYPIGTYVLVTGTCLVGGFVTYSAALEGGYEKVGNGALPRQIGEQSG